MTSSLPPKALLFVAVNWTISAYNISLIEALHAQGYRVDLLVTGRSRFRFTNFPGAVGNLIVVCNRWPKLYHYFWTLWRCLSILLIYLLPVDPWLRRAAKSALKERVYEAIIAIEKESLLLMGPSGLASDLGGKLHFWSHELYTVGYPRYYRYRSLDQWALKSLTVADGILVQDQQRYKVLVRHAPGACAKPFLLPVTERGAIYRGVKMDLHKRYDIASQTRILVSHGLVGKLRGFGLLCELSLELGENFAILVQGERLEELPQNVPKNLIIIDDRFDHDELLAFLAGCDIGLAIYAQNQIENDRLTARSSHKMALYARCGIPFVALRNESYEEVLAEIRWGALITSAQDGRPVIAEILAQHERYRQNAFASYEKFYQLEAYTAALLSYILKTHEKVKTVS